jgi:hypothetical protein
MANFRVDATLLWSFSTATLKTTTRKTATRKTATRKTATRKTANRIKPAENGKTDRDNQLRQDH